jgi:cobalt-zinc-cadmium efflux system membrane fusion protein
MGKEEMKQVRRLYGIARLVIPLAIGLVLGAFLYSRFMAMESLRPLPPRSAPRENASGRATLPDTVQISLTSQKELGIIVERASQRSLQDTLLATGIVSEDPGRVAHIRPLARGIIEKVYVRLGDRVSAGDPLLEYDNIELGIAIGELLSARAELQRSLTDLEVKRKILERSKEMLREGALARTTFDLREAECKDAEAITAGARAAAAKFVEQIRRFGWTDSDLENLDLKQGDSARKGSHSILRAPLSGVITSYHASPGESVEPSTELLAITDMSAVWVLADVFERDLPHIRLGKAVRVRVTSYPGEVLQGAIAYIADTLEPKTRTAKVRCLVQNSGSRLKLEMFATIEIPVDRSGRVLVVPDSAIQQIDGNSVIFARTSETEFQKRNVETGSSSGGFTEIRAGVEAGTPIVSRGSFLVKTEFLKDTMGGDSD